MSEHGYEKLMSKTAKALLKTIHAREAVANAVLSKFLIAHGREPYSPKLWWELQVQIRDALDEFDRDNPIP